MLEKELGTHNYQTIHENLLEVSKSKLSVTCVLSFCHIKAILFLLMFSLTFSACKNDDGIHDVHNVEKVPLHRYAILNPVASVNTIYWKNKFEHNDSLSYSALVSMINAFNKNKVLQNSKVYWSSQEDYADYLTAYNSLWTKVFYGNSVDVPEAFTNELNGLKERYVLLVKYTGYTRHWTNNITRFLLYAVNEISFGLFGIDEDDLVIGSVPDINMKVLAVDRMNKKVIYKGNRDFSFRNPTDSIAIMAYINYFFGQ